MESRLLNLDHIAERGCDLFQAVCERDLEGIVVKWAHGAYQTDGRGTSWLKIKNPEYTQLDGRCAYCVRDFLRELRPGLEHVAGAGNELR